MRDFQLYLRDDTGREAISDKGFDLSIPRRTWPGMASHRNQKGYRQSVHFTPNKFRKGVRRKENLELFRFWALDIDRKDFPNQTKEEIQEKIVKSPLEPTFIIETKNGYHLYWQCKKYLEITDAMSAFNSYSDFMSQCVVPFFNGDNASAKLTAMFRAPYYYQWKNYEIWKDSEDPFLVLPVHVTNRSYTWKEMNDAFPVIKKHDTKRYKDSGWIEQSRAMGDHDLLFAIPIVDVAKELGIRIMGQLDRDIVKATCPKHKDKTPSLCIYNKSKGKISNSFYCFSCQRGGNLINFIAYYLNDNKMTYKDAMKHIRQHYVQ